MSTTCSAISTRRSAQPIGAERDGIGPIAMTPRWRRVALVVLAAAAVVGLVAALPSVPLRGIVADWAARLQAFGAVGTLLFALLFGGLAMVFVPTTALTFVAGLVYGWSGAVLAWLVMMVVASLSFALARRLGAERLARAVRGRRRLLVLTDFIAGQGWRLVLLVRISGMVPFGVQNYAFGVTRIAFVQFIAATALGVLPSILLSAGAGIAGHEALAGEWDPVQLSVVAVSAVVSLTLIAVTARELRLRFAAAARAP